MIHIYLSDTVGYIIIFSRSRKLREIIPREKILFSEREIFLFSASRYAEESATLPCFCETSSRRNLVDINLSTLTRIKVQRLQRWYAIAQTSAYIERSSTAVELCVTFFFLFSNQNFFNKLRSWNISSKKIYQRFTELYSYLFRENRRF